MPSRNDSGVANKSESRVQDLENQLKSLRERYEFILRSMGEAFAHCEVIYDEQGWPVDWRYLDANRVLEQRLKVENVVGKRASELLGDVRSKAGNILSLYSRVAQSGQFETFAGYVDGLESWLHIRASSPRSGEVIAICEDITDQKRVEGLLDVSRERVALAQTLAGAGYWDWNTQTNEIHWTEQMYELFGVDRNRTTRLMDAWIERLHPEDREEAVRKIKEALSGNRNLYNEYRVVHPDGKLSWISVLGRGTYDEQGHNTHMTGICIDITARKKMESDLAIARGELEEDVQNFERLRNMSRRLWVGLEKQSLLSEILIASAKLMHTAMGIIFLIDEQANLMRSTVHAGLPFGTSMGDGIIHPGQYATGRAWNEARQIVVENVETDPGFAGTRGLQYTQEVGFRSIVATPLISRDNRVLGVISIYFKGVGRPRERNLQLLELYARQAADVIEFVDNRNVMKAQQERLKETLRLTQETKSQLEAVFEAIQDGICVFDRESHLVFANRALAKMGGFESVEVMRRQLGDVSRSLEFKSIPAFSRLDEWPVARVLRGESIRNMQLEARRIETGQEWVFHCSGEPVRDEQGEVILAVVVIRDVTEKKQAEELRATLESRDEFLSIASHELKTPLTTLHVALQLIRRMLADQQKFDSNQLERLSSRALESSDRLGRLVNELLDLTRIRAGKIRLEKKSVNLTRSVHAVLEQMNEEIRRAQIALSVRSDEAVIGDWDPSRIEQVIANLVSNAIKYGEGQPIEIEVKANPATQQALLVVRDYGMGIPEEMQSRIFQRFERGAINEKIIGLGLGLYIVRQIVEAHGGKVWVDSAPKKGSAFFVELPLKGPK